MKKSKKDLATVLCAMGFLLCGLSFTMVYADPASSVQTEGYNLLGQKSIFENYQADAPFAGISSEDAGYWHGETGSMGVVTVYDIPKNGNLNYLKMDGVATRNINRDGTGQPIDEGCLYFDAQVQFTATDTPPVIDVATDKLTVWLYDSDEETEALGNGSKLMVTTALVDENGVLTGVTTNLPLNVSVAADTWHQVTFKAIADSGARNADGSPCLGFEVFIDQAQVQSGDQKVFVSCVNPSLDKNITSVTFEGTGSVDNIGFYEGIIDVETPTEPNPDDAEGGIAWRYQVVDGGIEIIGYDYDSTNDIPANIVIPSQINGTNVVAIGERAFASCSGFVSVVMPDSVTSIGSAAFDGCTALSSLTISSTVTNINEYAFANCDDLTEIKLPSSLKRIGSYAFVNCDLLSNVIFSEGLKEIRVGAFAWCPNLISITLPDSVTFVGDWVFNACGKLETVSVPYELTQEASYSEAYITYGNMATVVVRTRGDVSSIIPTDGLVYQLDASDATSIVTNANGEVLEWVSRDGQIKFIADANAEAKPYFDATAFNGAGAVLFGSNIVAQVTNSTRLATSTVTDNQTVFIVNRPIVLQHYSAGIWGMDSGSMGVHIYSSTSLSARGWSNNSSFGRNGKLYLNGIKGQEWSVSFTIGEPQVLTVESASVRNFATAIGNYQGSGNYYYKGEIAEVIVYDRLLSDAERMTVEMYLREKWIAEENEVVVTPSSMLLTSLAQTNAFDVVALSEWICSVDQPWLTLNQTMGTNTTSIGFSVEQNTTGTNRSAKVIVSNGAFTTNCVIVQYMSDYFDRDIDFQTPQTIFADSDVVTNGILKYAYATWNKATVNDVHFSAGGYPTFGTDVSFDGLSSYGGIGLGNATVAPWGSLSENYKKILTSTMDVRTVYLHNLTVGKPYLIQLWANLSTSDGVGKVMSVTSGKNSQKLMLNSTGTYGGVGQYVIGYFIADSTTKSFTLSSSTGSTQFNSLQVRELDALPQDDKEDEVAWRYNVVDGGLEITGYDRNTEIPSDLIVPSQINGTNVIAIGNNAFNHSPDLTSVTVSDGIELIDYTAFASCANLTNIVIGKSVRSIEYYTFDFCPKLEAINVHHDNQYFMSIDGVLYNKAQTQLIRCPQTKSGDFIIPDGVQTLPYRAFDECCYLTSMTIPASVKSIGSQVFTGCFQISAFNVNDANQYFSSVDGVLFNKDKTSLLYYPLGKEVDEYEIPNTVNKIQTYAFLECTNLSRIIIPSSVMTIGERALDLNGGGGLIFEGEPPQFNGTTMIASNDIFGYYTPEYAAAWNAAIDEDGYYYGINMRPPSHPDVTLNGIHWIGEGDEAWTILQESPFVAKSGNINHNETTALNATVDGAGVLSFNWKVSSEQNYDFLRLFCDGVDVDAISGSDGGWKSLALPFATEGTHTITWIYEKDRSVNSYEDCGWISNVVWTAGLPDASHFFTYEETSEGVVITGHKYTSVSTIVIPSEINGHPVVGVDNVAFAGREDLVSITLPENLQWIGDDAFYGCLNLETVEYPDGFDIIPFVSAFEGTLFYETFEDGLLVSNGWVYGYKGDLPETLMITNSAIVGVAENAFYSRFDLRAVVLGDTVQEIGRQAFAYCGLESVVLGEGIAKIRRNAFYGSSHLQLVLFKGKPAQIVEGGAFDEGVLGQYPSRYKDEWEAVCMLNGDYMWWNGLRMVSSDDFYEPSESGFTGYLIGSITNRFMTITGYKGEMPSNLIIPEELNGIPVRAIGEQAFLYAYNLENVTIPDSVTTLGVDSGYGVFEGCYNLTNVVWGSGIKEIPGWTFYDCESLSDITIPNFVTRVGESSFHRTAFWNAHTNEVVILDGWVLGVADYDGTLELQDLVLSNDIKGIADGGLSYSYSLCSVDTSDSLQYIGEGAFANCYNLTNIVLRGQVETIPHYAFNSCANLASITLPESIRVIGDYAFSDCPKLTEIFLPDGVTSISENAFFYCYCDSLLTISISKALADILGADYEAILTKDNNATVVVREPSVKTYLATFDLGAYGTRTGGGELEQTVEEGKAAVAPEFRVAYGYEFIKWSESFTSVSNNLTVIAEYRELERTLSLSSSVKEIAENTSSPMIRFVLNRTGPITEALTVSLTSSSDDIVVPETVEFPVGSSRATFNAEVQDNNKLDGRREVVIAASVENYGEASAMITVTDDEVPSISLTLETAEITEGQKVVIGTVTRDFVTDEPLTVYLSGMPASQCTYPSSVVIPAGEASVSFELVVVDNDTAEIGADYVLRANAAGYTTATLGVKILDDDVPGVTLELSPAEVSESAGAYAAYAALTRVDENKIENPITVKLTPSEKNQLILPASITIPARTMSVRFAVGTIDNALDDGDREVIINGAILIESCGCSGQPSSGDAIQAVVQINDDDGPALKLTASPTTMKEGDDRAGFLTLSHNTTLTEDLVVALSYDKENEIEVAETVTIPAGETSVGIPVTTLDDGVEDGAQTVSVYADAEGFSSGSTWVLVSDQNLPDFKPADVTPEYQTVIAGETLELTFDLVNIGFKDYTAGVPYAVHLVAGASSVTTTDETLVFSGKTATGLAMNEKALVTVEVKIPTTPGDYRFAVVADPDGVIAEPDNVNNTGWSQPVTVNPSYVATAEVAGDTFLKGEEVLITGVATMEKKYAPAANVAVEVYVIVNGIRRTLTATTDAAGNFEATFKPLEGEAGHFIVGASYPGVGSTAKQDAFDILGMERTATSHVIWDVTIGDVATRTVDIRNLTPIRLTGLKVETVDCPEECSLVCNLAETLGGNGYATLEMTATATGISEGTDYKKFYVRITSAEGVTLEIPLYFYSQSQKALLKANPATIKTTMAIGTTRYVEFTIMNAGQGDSGKITVSAPSADWLRIVGGSTIQNLKNNESAVVTVELAPTDTLELGNPLTGRFAVNCANGKGLVVPFTFTPVSNEKGKISVDVTDEYTYYLADAPHVSGATVRVTNPYTGEVVATGTTGEDGKWESEEVLEGKYNVSVSATKHSSYIETVTVDPSETTSMNVFLQFQAITADWKVERTEVEDQYDITLELEYETNVPAPVLKMGFPDELPILAEGESYAFNVVLQNIGLIAAQGVKLNLPSIEGYTFKTPVYNQTLAAGASMTIPVVFTRPKVSKLKGARASTVVTINRPCNYYTEAEYYYVCLDDEWVRRTRDVVKHGYCPYSYIIDDNPEEPEEPGDPGRGGGGGGGYGTGGIGSGNGATHPKKNCDPRFNSVREAMENCKERFADIVDIWTPILEEALPLTMAKQICEEGCELSTQERLLMELIADSNKDVDDIDWDTLKKYGYEMYSDNEKINSMLGLVASDKDLRYDEQNGVILGDASFKASLYRNGDEVILAFALEDSFIGIATEFTRCFDKKQYERARELLAAVLNTFPAPQKITVIGYALGGSLAQYAMAKNKLENRVVGLTYNSLGVCENEVNPELLFSDSQTSPGLLEAQQKIKNYRAMNDPGSVSGMFVGTVVTAKINGEKITTGHSLNGVRINPKASPLFYEDWQSLLTGINYGTDFFGLDDFLMDWLEKKHPSIFKKIGGKFFKKLEKYLKYGELAYAGFGSLYDLQNCFEGLKETWAKDPKSIKELYAMLVNDNYQPTEFNTGNDELDQNLKMLESSDLAAVAARSRMGGYYGGSLGNDGLDSVATASISDDENILYGNQWVNADTKEILSFMNAIADVTINNNNIDEITADMLLAYKPTGISDATVEYMVERLKNTALQLSSRQTDRNGNSIDFGQIERANKVLVNIYKYAQKMGYENPVDMWTNAVNNINAILDEEKDSICASVSLKLSQTATMTREAFDGTLTLFNGHASTPMTNIKLDLSVTDSEGNVCNDLFGITPNGLDVMTGGSILNGEGELASGKTGTAKILFVPSRDAAPEVSKTYYFGGTLSYTDPFTGETATMKLTAVPLAVNPSPYLKLDYFVQRDVYGNDPFTADKIEPSLPAEVSVLIQNKGYGDAKNVIIDSVQPEIFKNDKGLQIDFKLMDYSTSLNGSLAHLGLKNVNLGTIAAQENAVAQWWLTSSLQGHFIGMSAKVSQRNSWGNQDANMSLIDEDVGVHELIRSIVVNGETKPAFLVSENDVRDLPDMIYTSSGDVIAVHNEAVATCGAISDGTMTLSINTSASGWNYASVVNETLGNYEIKKVVRSDGTEIPLRNAWLTDRTFRDSLDTLYENRIHIVDDLNSVGMQTYTLTLEVVNTDGPNVVAFEGVMAEAVLENALDFVDVFFDRMIDPSTFTIEDLTLYHQGTRVEGLNGLTIAQIDEEGLKFRIGNLASVNAADGMYELIVQAAGIANADGTFGLSGKSVTWVVAGAASDTIPPAQITDLRITPDRGVSDSDGITCSTELMLTGTLPEDGLTVAVYSRYASGNDVLMKTLKPEDRALTVPLTLASGGNVTLVVVCTDAAGNSSETTLPVFVDMIDLTATVSGMPELNLPVKDGLLIAFSDEVVAGDLTAGVCSLALNGAAVSVPGMAFEWVDAKTCRVTGLEAATAQEGTYVFAVDLASVHKKLSGKMGTGVVSVEWKHVPPDTTSPTVGGFQVDGADVKGEYLDGFSKIQIQFSEEVNVPELIANEWITQAVRLMICKADGVVTGAFESVASDYAWNATDNVLTWTLAKPFVHFGDVKVVLDGALVKDKAGNPLSTDGFEVTELGLTRFGATSALVKTTAQAMPTWYDFNGDGLGDLIVGEKASATEGKVRIYLNAGSANAPSFNAYTYLQTNGSDLVVPASGCQGASVCFQDLTGDGIDDLLVGQSDGKVALYAATAKGVFGAGEEIWPLTHASLSSERAVLTAFDVDADGKKELIVGGIDGKVRVIKYDAGTKSVTADWLTTAASAPLAVLAGRSSPTFADVSSDRSVEMASGDTQGNVWLFAKNGTSFIKTPIKLFDNSENAVDALTRSRTCLADVNTDGVSDLLIGTADGSVRLMSGTKPSNACIPLCVTRTFTLAEALDTDGLMPEFVWTTGGDVPWFVQTAVVSEGIAATQSGTIDHGKESWIETTVEGAGTLAFKWKVSCEERYDSLQLLVDGVVSARLTGEQDWQTHDVVLTGDGLHTIRWRYAKSRSGVAGSDCAWLDHVVWAKKTATELTLKDALDADNVTWKATGDAAWFAQTDVAYDSLDAARSGKISNYGSSKLETVVYGPGKLTYAWKVSCEEGYDWFDLLMDGELTYSITGETDWETMTVIIPEGRHVLTWEYWKDDYDEEGITGEDCAWLDFVKVESVAMNNFTTSTPEPVPHEWLAKYDLLSASDYNPETAANADHDGDGLTAWQEYIVGSDPTNETSKFTAKIEMDENGLPKISWEPDRGDERKYTVEGKASLTDKDWALADETTHRFFRVKVEMP